MVCIMGTRLELQTLLEGILGSDNVYFQPPSSKSMDYPCIRYELSDVRTKFANNIPYSHKKQYQLTIIDEDPDSGIPDKIAKLPMCAFDRPYTANNLNHYVYNIYY